MATPDAASARPATKASRAAAVRLSATPVSPTQIRLTWTRGPAGVRQYAVYRTGGSVGGWVLAGNVAAKSTRYNVTKLSPATRYTFRVGLIGSVDGSRYSTTASASTLRAPAQPPAGNGNTGNNSNTGNIVYSGPVTITHGGVYSGNWQSLYPSTPAVQVRTSEPVIIQNSHIRSAGSCIDVSGYAGNVTVRNTYGYGLNPNVYGRYPGRFLDVDGFTNIVAENNYMEGTSGIYLYNYLGNHTAAQTVKVLRNIAHNIDGRYSDGKGGFLTGPNDNYYVQFFQTNGLTNMTGVEVAWNQVINDPGQGRVEENINVYASSGTPTSPFLIHDNYIQGAYPADPVNDTTYTGGGIMVSDVGSSWIRAYNNQVVNTGSQGITISSGHDNAFYNNRIISSGLLPDGTPMPYSNVGATIWNYNHERTFANNSGWANVIGWEHGGGHNDWWVPDAARWTKNTSIPGDITKATEAAEWTLWQAKLLQAGIRIGP